MDNPRMEIGMMDTEHLPSQWWYSPLENYTKKFDCLFGNSRLNYRDI